jgi:hypothetical protein
VGDALSSWSAKLLFSIQILLLSALIFLMLNSSAFAVVNGKKVGREDPISRSIVAVFFDGGNFWCTGTVVARDLVLTAAHCVPHEHSDKIWIAFGGDVHDLYQDRDDYRPGRSATQDSKVIGVSDFAIAQLVDGESEAPDLALIKTADNISKFWPDVQSLALYDETVPLEIHQWVSTYGYGKVTTVEGADNGIGFLRSKNLEIFKLSDDGSLAELNQPQGGTCQGDSGGPALAMKNGNWQIWAVASETLNIKGAAVECVLRSRYTKVEGFLPWLRSTALQLGTRL